MKNSQKEILDFVEKVIEDRPATGQYYLDFGKLNKKEVQVLSDVVNKDLTDYVRTFDDSGVIHALKHKNIEVIDFLLIPFIVNHYDVVGEGKKPNTIVYKKLINDVYFYVEEVRSGRRKLAIKTLYKRKKRQPKG